MSIPAGTARSKRDRLGMVSSRIRFATNITWICAVSCSHTHLHVPSTFHITHPQPPHLLFGLVGARSGIPMPAGAARGRRCRLHMASSIIRLATTITWICAVSCSHTHLHVPSTFLIHDLHTSRVGWLGLDNSHASWHSTGQEKQVVCGKLQNMGGCYFSVDMRRILLTHTSPRIKHIDHPHPRPPHLLFGLVGA